MTCLLRQDLLSSQLKSSPTAPREVELPPFEELLLKRFRPKNDEAAEVAGARRMRRASRSTVLVKNADGGGALGATAAGARASGDARQHLRASHDTHGSMGSLTDLTSIGSNNGQPGDEGGESDAALRAKALEAGNIKPNTPTCVLIDVCLLGGTHWSETPIKVPATRLSAGFVGVRSPSPSGATVVGIARFRPGAVVASTSFVIRKENSMGFNRLRTERHASPDVGA